jgi:teichoic acid transport system ATP-binding protein
MAATDKRQRIPLEGPEADAQLSISIRDLHVRYRVNEERRLTAAELVRRGFRSRQASEVHAIRGIDVDIRVGESVGLVGSNGSGKSTLLRCIAGLQPTSGGQVLVRGRAQLLAVSAALDPMLSGRRNVVLGGLAMGLTREEIEQRYDEVVEFSGLADAINRPLRTYSSGMRARLSFSIATMKRPPILLIDEALAVGDRKFRKKSLALIRKIRADASTVMMVTHNLSEIRNTCTRTIWLDQGRIILDGQTQAVLAAYADVGDDDDDDVTASD